MNLNNKFAISCDWLQIHVKHPDNFLEVESAFYSFKKIGQSKVFKDIYEIKDIIFNKSIANYCCNANECIMPKNEGVLKFENSQLYIYEDLKIFVEKMLSRLNFRFIGITRFDIAFDFQKFQNEYDPKDFIKDYLGGKNIKLKGNKFGVYGEQKEQSIDYQSISFGSKTSNITAKMYNKTEELKTNCKPWIKEHHKVNDLVESDSDIWRLEFSLSSMQAFLKGEGKDFSFHSLECLEIQNMYGIFIGCFSKNFRFKRKDLSQKRMTRLKDVKLWNFDLSFTELRIVAKNPMVKQSTRSERIFIKKLDTLNREFRIFDENFDYTAKELISKVINMHSLEEWATDNNIEFSGQKDYINNIYQFIDSNVIENQKTLSENFENAITGAESCNIYE